MKIAINGAGVAGPALAWWLKRYGYQPVLFEQAPKLRTGGYMIDFWGVGYDVADKMGLLPELHKKGYDIASLQVVGEKGEPLARLNTANLISFIGDRYLSIARGDLAAAIYSACDNVETRFDCSITGVEQQSDGVVAKLSNGKKESFDLVIGADGLHSEIRSQVFGPEDQYEFSLGAYVAAFTLSGYESRDEWAYVSHAMPKRQIARASLRDDKTLFLFTFRSELVKERPKNVQEEKKLLRSLFSGMKWEAPSILARLDEAEGLYFDHVSQIRMDRWSSGRVALIGDAAACVSLLAGEGTGLAMAEAYILAGELRRAKGDYQEAFRRYEMRLKPFLIQKQKTAMKMIAFFAPKNKFEMFLSRMFIKASSIPFLSKFFMGQSLKDDIDLPNYEDDSSSARN